VRLPAILVGGALCCAAAPPAAPPTRSPAIDLLLRGLAKIELDYVTPVDLEAVAARGVGAIRDQAQAEPGEFAACMADRASAPHPGIESAAATALLDALECAKTPPERLDPTVDAALRAMVEGLDPRSHYYDPAQHKALFAAQDGGTVGLRLTRLEDVFAVVATDPGSPARAAGIEAGERLLFIGTRPLDGKSPEQVDDMLKGEVGTQVVLTFAAPGGAEREVSLSRMSPGGGMELEAEAGDGVLILHVHSLGRGLRAEMDKAIRDLPGPPRAVIVDLRSNEGGLLDTAVWLADAFLDRGRIVESRGRGKRSETFRASKGQEVPAVPLVLLVDSGTAAGAEIVAAALQDNKRALVVGAVTHGEGRVQTFLPIDPERAIRLTTAFEYRADGRRLQDAPVVPDCPTAASGEAAVALAVAVGVGDRSSCGAAPAPAP
jgi:carboxyl-terminal processing protease